MANPELEKYVKSAREQKVPDEQIRMQLVQSGWAEAEVIEAMVPSSLSVPTLPPPPVPHFGMWVAFQYIILFISLYMSATSFAGILHYAVSKLIPDALDKTSYLGSFYDNYLIRGYLAALIVAFPIFAFLYLLLKKQVLATPAIRNLRARKQLIYITLVGTFLIMFYDVIRTVYDLLSGAVTARSIANFFITVLVAGSIFIYFILEVKGDRKR